jgi:UDP-N-acetylglucosamine kinase
MAAENVPLPSDEIDRIYRDLIQPTLFDAATTLDGDAPTLILLGGQPGAGKSRTSARLTADHDRPIVALSGDDLRIFHPDYRSLIAAAPEQAGLILAEATSTWVRAAIQDALDLRHSLLLEGTFGDPDIALATAKRFREAGFHVRIVAVASPGVLSLITITSRYLRDLNADAPARFTRLSAHDRGYEGTTRLIGSLDATAPVDQVVIISRNGKVLYDGDGVHTLEGAETALREGRNPESWGARSTMEILGELKQITGYAIASQNLSPEITELLVTAHQLALAEVVPHLSVANDSPQATFIQRAVSEQLVALNRAAAGDNQAGSMTITSPEPSGPEAD